MESAKAKSRCGQGHVTHAVLLMEAAGIEL